MAKVVAINISVKKGIPKDQIEQGVFIENFGLEGDVHGGDWHRQVSLLSQESIDKAIAMGADGLEPGKFAENITTEGIVLYELPVGTRLQIGETIQEVTQIGKVCHQKCAIFHTVGDCVMPKEGIFTKVIKGGVVKPGDHIEIL
ncbi:MOSC domain-containing protein [Alkaliphilus oremlandii]|uniref:MOSC domain containing protein n=1 Tax=Alkaliphilus oremlandii (strain OhILAs) TaxID=350688 RepID=A8MF53_ALKOO|nr:MOSC domain-containing protein [Alkaliphilus oremlandii]ABW18722.1 MOSC domain containing protein [Alkaliphilus oremlandii OhILAs]